MSLQEWIQAGACCEYHVQTTQSRQVSRVATKQAGPAATKPKVKSPAPSKGASRASAGASAGRSAARPAPSTAEPRKSRAAAPAASAGVAGAKASKKPVTPEVAPAKPVEASPAPETRVEKREVSSDAGPASTPVDRGAPVERNATMQAQPAQAGAEFKVGDKAVYPRGGVAEVIGIEELDIAGNRQRFYVLRLLQNNSKIRVPVGNANAVGLRQLISEQEILEVFDILRERTIAFDKQTWNRRYRGFMEKIKTGSIYDVAEVLRDLYRLKTDKQLSFGERRMLDEARSLIVKEIAIARDQTEDQVKNEIEAIFLTN